MADGSINDSDDDGGAVVFPRPAGKRIRTADMSSGSDDSGDDERVDEPEEELLESEEEEDDYMEDVSDEEDDVEEYTSSDKGSGGASSSRYTEDLSDKKSKKKSKKAKKEKKEKSHRPPKAKKSRYGKSIFLDEAEVGGSDEEEEEDLYEESLREERAMEPELRAIQKEAEARAASRHESNRRFQEASASDVVADIESRYQREKVGRQGGYLGSAEGYMSETTRQSLVPGVNDPGIFMVRAKTGMEQTLVKSILLKSIDRQRKGQKLQIKSVFSTATAGYIYIEAMNEPFAREAISGLNGIYHSTLKQVPIPEMSKLFTVTEKKKPIKEGQWCRMRRGPNKGDLARVLRLLEGGTKALVQVVPRPDYELAEGGGRKKAAVGAARPLQRLFLAETAKGKGHEVERKRNPVTGEFNEFWNNEYYSRGYLFKEVKVDTFLMHANNPLPRLEEMTLFQEKKQGGGDGGDDDDDEGGGAGGAWNSKQGIMRELAKLEEEFGGKGAGAATESFLAGDTVQVIEGEQRNLRGVVVSINNGTGLAVVQPLSEYQLGHLTIETSLLIKYIRPGAHVKVLSGQHLGQTGRVVSVYRQDGDNIAAILTDGVNMEITVNMGHLQVTSEVTTGLNSLGGYELYDLLMLSANDYGVVVFVGTEHLSVLNLNDIVKEVRPMDVKGKKAPSRGATGAFDHLKNPLAIGDTVSVVEGTYAKKTGTIKHINRSVLWLHSTSHLKNSGIFVVKGKSCLLAGSKVKGTSNTAATMLNAAFNTDAQQPGATLIRSASRKGGGGKGGGRDEDHGKAVKLTSGGYKGHLGRIVDSTNTHYSVELHGRMKTVSVIKSKVKFVDGDRPSMGDSYVAGGRGGAGRGPDGGLIPSTPFLAGQTPQHLTGSETPSLLQGNMTPNRPETPGRDSSSVWHASTVLDASNDSISQQHQQRGYDSASPMTGDSAGWHHSNSGGWGVGGDMDMGGGGGGWEDSHSHGQGHHQRPHANDGYGSGGGGGGGSNDRDSGVADWDVDMIVEIRFGEYTGKFAIIAEKPIVSHATGQWTVALRLRESSSSARRSESNPIFIVDCRDVQLAEPRRKDRVAVLHGANRGFVGTLKGVIGQDAILVELPHNLFKLSQVAWLHKRT